MSAYDEDEDDVMPDTDELNDIGEGFTIADNPDDPEVDLEASDLADFTFTDDDDLGDEESEDF